MKTILFITAYALAFAALLCGVCIGLGWWNYLCNKTWTKRK